MRRGTTWYLIQRWRWDTAGLCPDWSAAGSLLWGHRMKFVMGVLGVGNSRIWDDCCGSQCPVYSGASNTQLGVRNHGPWSTIPFRVSTGQAWKVLVGVRDRSCLILNEFEGTERLEERRSSPGDIGTALFYESAHPWRFLMKEMVLACPNCFILWQMWKHTSYSGWARD